MPLADRDSTPSFVTRVGGNQKAELHQESSTGKPVFRKGAASTEADIDLATASNPRDLTSSGDGNFDSGQKSTGGAEALSGHIKDDDGTNFDVKIDWLNDNGDTLITDSRSELTGVSDVKFNLVVRSDHFKVRVESSNAQKVHGTINAH